MSIFNTCRPKIKINGSIQINENNFGFFGMEIENVKNKLSPCLETISKNMKEKNISGKLTFCEFEKHDGPHISLWMDSEETENSTKSIEIFSEKEEPLKLKNLTFSSITAQFYLLLRVNAL